MGQRITGQNGFAGANRLARRARIPRLRICSRTYLAPIKSTAKLSAMPAMRPTSSPFRSHSAAQGWRRVSSPALACRMRPAQGAATASADGRRSAPGSGAVPALHVACTVCALVNDGVLSGADARKVGAGCRSLEAAIEASCGARAAAVARLLPPSLLDGSLWQHRGWTVGMRASLQNNLWRPLACAGLPCSTDSKLPSQAPFLAAGTCPTGACADPVSAVFGEERSPVSGECSACPVLRVEMPRVERSSRLARRVGWHRVLTVAIPARPRLADAPHGVTSGACDGKADLAAAKRRWELLVRSLCERGFQLGGRIWDFAQARWGALEVVFVARRSGSGRFADASAVRRWHIPPDAANRSLLSNAWLASARLDLLVSSTAPVARAAPPSASRPGESLRLLPYRRTTAAPQAAGDGWSAFCPSHTADARRKLRLVWEEDACTRQGSQGTRPSKLAAADGGPAAASPLHILSDGCGAIPAWLGRAAASEAAVRPGHSGAESGAGSAWTPAAVQARFGGCKGLWVVSPVLPPDSIVCRPSQQKIILQSPSAEQLDFEALRAIGGALQPAAPGEAFASHCCSTAHDRRSRCRGRLSEQTCGLLLCRGVPVEHLAEIAAEAAAVGAAAQAGSPVATSALLGGRSPHEGGDWISASAEARDFAVVRALHGAPKDSLQQSAACAGAGDSQPRDAKLSRAKAAFAASLLAEAGQRAAAALRSDVRERLRVPLPLSRRLALVPDPTGVLRPGEAFVRLSAASLATLRNDASVWWASLRASGEADPSSGAGETEESSACAGTGAPESAAALGSRSSVTVGVDGVLRGSVFAIRSPAHLPSHVVGLQCVSLVEAAARAASGGADEGALPPLGESLLWRDALVDVLVLAADPSSAAPSDAARLSGGDFDGDEALVVFDDRLVRPLRDAHPLCGPERDAGFADAGEEDAASRARRAPASDATDSGCRTQDPETEAPWPDVPALVRRWLSSVSDELPSVGRIARAHSFWLERLAESGGTDGEAASAVRACGQAAAALITASKHGPSGGPSCSPPSACLDCDTAAAWELTWRQTVARGFAMLRPCPAPSAEWIPWAEHVAMPLSAAQRREIEAAAADAAGKAWRAQTVDLLDLPRRLSCSHAQVAAVLLCLSKSGVSTTAAFRLFGDGLLQALCADE